MIDYDSPTFQDVLISRGNGKGDITPITNLELAYKAAKDRTISAPDLCKLCGIELYGDAANNTTLQLLMQSYKRWLIFLPIYTMTKTLIR